MFKTIISTAFLVFFAAAASSCGGAEVKATPRAGEVAIAGVITITQNEPHTWCIITPSGQKPHRITGPQEKKIRAKFQNRSITVVGTITEKGEGLLPPVIAVRAFFAE